VIIGGPRRDLEMGIRRSPGTIAGANASLGRDWGGATAALRPAGAGDPSSRAVDQAAGVSNRGKRLAPSSDGAARDRRKRLRRLEPVEFRWNHLNSISRLDLFNLERVSRAKPASTFV